MKRTAIVMATTLVAAVVVGTLAPSNARAAGVTASTTCGGWHNAAFIATITAKTGAPNMIVLIDWWVDTGSKHHVAVSPGHTSYTISVSLSGADGDHAIGYQAFGLLGTYSSPQYAGYGMDRVPPAVTAVGAGGANLSLWHNHAITVNISATDGTSGVARTWYRLDSSAGEDWVSTTGSAASATISTVGNHHLDYSADDKAGNGQYSPIPSVHAMIDLSAPVTSVSGGSGVDLSLWHNHAVTLTFNASDPGYYITQPSPKPPLLVPLSGVAKTEYKIDSGPWTVGTSLALSTDGDHLVSYRSTDNASNVEATKSVHVKTDAAPPATTMTSGGEDLALWHGHDVTLSFAAADPGSGVAKTEYAVDGGSWTQGTSVTITAEGDHAVKYRSTDNAGNVEADRPCSVKIHRGPPTVAVSSGAEDLALWHNHDLALTFTAEDPQGVASIEYQLDGGTWSSGASLSVEALADHSNDGEHAVACRATDVAGNIAAPVTTQARIDTRRPTTKAPYAASVARGHPVKLKYRVDDASPNGGTASVTIKVKTLGGTTVKTLKLGTKAVNVSLSKTFRVPRTWKVGTYRFFVYATDGAGNVQSKVGSNKLIVK